MVVAALRIKRENEEKVLIKKYHMVNDTKDDPLKIQKGIDLDELYFLPNSLKLKTISFMKVPKLDWDDRRIELRQSEE